MLYRIFKNGRPIGFPAHDTQRLECDIMRTGDSGTALDQW